MLETHGWIEPSYEEPEGVVITESEREMEDEIYREDPNAPKAMWSCGGWAKKSDSDGQPAKRAKLSKPEARTRHQKLVPKKITGQNTTNAGIAAPMTLLAQANGKHELAANPGPVKETVKTSKRRDLEPPDPIRFAEDHVDPPEPSSFITDPRASMIQCIKVMCGNYGVRAGHFISLYVGTKGVSGVIDQVFEVLDTGFLRLLDIPRRYYRRKVDGKDVVSYT